VLHGVSPHPNPLWTPCSTRKGAELPSYDRQHTVQSFGNNYRDPATKGILGEMIENGKGVRSESASKGNNCRKSEILVDLTVTGW
jgi:hypothetical protein